MEWSTHPQKHALVQIRHFIVMESNNIIRWGKKKKYGIMVTKTEGGDWGSNIQKVSTEM